MATVEGQALRTEVLAEPWVNDELPVNVTFGPRSLDILGHGFAAQIVDVFDDLAVRHVFTAL